ncbi:SET domain-containing protein [Peniophora sp. CONT]|nr:SET domain-containing protein [Peniophora sp. CONT]
MATATSSASRDMSTLRNTTSQPSSLGEHQVTFDLLKYAEMHESTRTESGRLLVTLPNFKTKELEADGTAECLLTPWMKTMITSTPGWAQPIIHPPSVRYDIRRAPGSRGLGMFATADIEAGALILAERPLIVKMTWFMPRVQDAHLPYEEQAANAKKFSEEQMESVYSRMSPENQKKYMSLSNSHQHDGSGPLTGISRTNGWGVDVGAQDPEVAQLGVSSGTGYSAVGEISSRFNHSCLPNVKYTFNLQTFSMEFHAVRPIAKGEEMTVAYTSLEDRVELRQNKLKPYGFICTCSACKGGPLTDLQRLHALKSVLPKTSQGVQNADAVLAAFELTSLQSQPRYPELLQRVAKINRKAGNRARADELDALAAKVSTAILGRKPPEPPKPEGKGPVVWNAEELMALIMSQTDPVKQQHIIDVLEQAAEVMQIHGQEQKSERRT